MFKSMDKILITGAAGSCGSYMTEHLIRSYPEARIYPLARNAESLKKRYIQSTPTIYPVYCDLSDWSATLQMVRDVQPTHIFHFASNANVHQSFEQPLSILKNNIFSSAHLFESLRLQKSSARVLLCSTSEVYGQVRPDEVPISEKNAIRPASPYAVSKTTQDLLADVYFSAYGLSVIKSRMFTYINPRRANLFATAFALQVARIEAGQATELVHGNLESVRTHLDIRDAIEAYVLLMDKGVPGEVYNLGGEVPFTIGDFLTRLKSQARCEIRSREDATLLRPVDVTLQIPDVRKFYSLTGWKPRFNLSQSVEFLLSECRASVARENSVS